MDPKYKKYIEEIENYAFIKEMNLTIEEKIENSLLIKKAINTLKMCNSSQNANECGADGYHFKLIRKNNKLELVTYQCEKISNNLLFKIGANYLYSNINLENNLHFLKKDNIIIENEGTNQADFKKVKFVNFLISQKRNDVYEDFYLYGELLTSKSYLVIALCNELALKNKKICYLIMPQFVLDVQRILGQNYELMDLIHKLKTCDILVLDELGNEQFQRQIHGDFLLSIINYRFENLLPIFFISSYSIHNLTKKYQMDVFMKSDLINLFVSKMKRNINENNIFKLERKYSIIK